MSETINGTVVLIGAGGVLIRGESGSGKSSLALALIERGARLVADDRVTLAACGDRLVATAPRSILGLIELRGRGLIEAPHERSAVLRLVVDIVETDALDRMPEDHHLMTELLGIAVPRQPVPPVAEWARRLIEAALRAQSARPGGGLRSAELWG